MNAHSLGEVALIQNHMTSSTYSKPHDKEKKTVRGPNATAMYFSKAYLPEHFTH